MSMEDDIKAALASCNYSEYNRLLKEYYGVPPVVPAPEFKGGNRVVSVDPNFFGYGEYGNAFYAETA